MTYTEKTDDSQCCIADKPTTGCVNCNGLKARRRLRCRSGENFPKVPRSPRTRADRLRVIESARKSVMFKQWRKSSGLRYSSGTSVQPVIHLYCTLGISNNIKYKVPDTYVFNTCETVSVVHNEFWKCRTCMWNMDKKEARVAVCHYPRVPNFSTLWTLENTILNSFE